MFATKEAIEQAEHLFLVVEGGIGKNINATAIVRNLKKAYPTKKISVMCGCPDLFIRNPNVERAYSLGQPVFIYDDYFKDKKTIVVRSEPYHSFDYVYKKKHIVECWCDQLGIPCDNVFPEVFFTDDEKRMAELYLEKFDKEMVLFQGEGGKVPNNSSEVERIGIQAGMYKRSLKHETLQKVSDEIIKRGFMVGVVCTPNQFLPAAAERINFSIRAILALIPHVAAVIGVDSFLMHGTALYQKRSVIAWGGTDPKVLGYEFNDNLTRESCPTPMCHRPNSFLWDFEQTGFLWDCPHSNACMNYDALDIIKAFDNLVGGRHGKRKAIGDKPAVDGCKADCGTDKNKN